MLVAEEIALVENRLLVHAEKEGPSLNAKIAQTLGKPRGIHTGFLRQHDPVHPIHVSGPRLLHRQLQASDVLEPARILLSQPALASDDRFHPFQLAKSQSGLD